MNIFKKLGEPKEFSRVERLPVRVWYGYADYFIPENAENIHNPFYCGSPNCEYYYRCNRLQNALNQFLLCNKCKSDIQPCKKCKLFISQLLLQYIKWDLSFHISPLIKYPNLDLHMSILYEKIKKEYPNIIIYGMDINILELTLIPVLDTFLDNSPLGIIG